MDKVRSELHKIDYKKDLKRVKVRKFSTHETKSEGLAGDPQQIQHFLGAWRYQSWYVALSDAEVVKDHRWRSGMWVWQDSNLSSL